MFVFSNFNASSFELTTSKQDVVDDHNLNRQVLFGKKHVGKSKVFSAAEVLRVSDFYIFANHFTYFSNDKEHHNLVSEIVPIEINVLTNWNVVVEQAKQSTIIFNMIDVGDYFDYAVQSLALSLGIPFCQGGTFQYTLTIDFVDKNGTPCIACLNDSYPDTEVTDKLTPTQIQTHTDISFLPSKTSHCPKYTKFIHKFSQQETITQQAKVHF